MSLHISSSSQLLAVQFFTLQFYMILRLGIFFFQRIFFFVIIIIIIVIRTPSCISPSFPPSFATVAKSDSLLRKSKPSVNGFEVLNYT